VNLAARLEGLNKRYGTRNLVSAETRLLAGEGLLFRSVAIVIPVGTTRSVEVYELLGAVEDKNIAGLSEWVRRWEVAMAAIRRGNASEALALFEALAAERPADGLAAFYAARSSELARGPSLVSWDGVDKLSEK
jgi:adenylate cyclase